MTNIKHNAPINRRSIGPHWGLAGAALLALAAIPVSARDHRDQGEAFYQQTNLVADLAGVAQVQDTNLVNAWGISFGATSPFWVSANGAGLALLYAVTNDPAGNPVVAKQGLEVMIPGEGNPTGQLFNGLGGFHGDIFIFASEDGTISGWRGALGTNAEVLTMRSNAVYKGITIVPGANGPLLLVANFSEGTVDAYDTNLTLVQYSDPTVPTGYAPFNIRAMGDMVFVTFAKQDDLKHDDDPGPGHGLIATFDPTTHMFHRLATGSDAGGDNMALNSPWGLAISPQGFGEHGDQLLVGNFGSGTIMAFEADGDFEGVLKGSDRQPIVIEGLWGLTFGNGGRGGVPGTLYFSAGPGDEAHGLFGSLVAVGGEEDHDHGHGHGHVHGHGHGEGHGHGHGNHRGHD